MNLRTFYIASGVAVAAMLAIAAWGLTQVGLDASVPTHWDIQGRVDGHAPAWIGFLLLPAITSGIVVLMAVLPRIEPRRDNLRRSSSAYRTMATAVVLLMAVIQVVVVLSGVGVMVPVGLVVGLGVGALFVIMGNILTTVRSNFMFGVRTPWTLTSERSWDRTHRLVGRLFVLTGLVMVALSITGELALVMGAMLMLLALTVGAGYWYSYRQWVADPDRRPTGEGA